MKEPISTGMKDGTYVFECNILSLSLSLSRTQYSIINNNTVLRNRFFHPTLHF